MMLVILEPLVTFVFASLALLGLLTTLFFYLVGPPEFPVWTICGNSPIMRTPRRAMGF
jgi:hypothetical protein